MIFIGGIEPTWNLGQSKLDLCGFLAAMRRVGYSRLVSNVCGHWNR